MFPHQRRWSGNPPIAASVTFSAGDWPPLFPTSTVAVPDARMFVPLDNPGVVRDTIAEVSTRT